MIYRDKITMIKNILLGLLITTLTSCINKEKVLSDQVISLEKKNDSLTSLLSEFEGKYIFDSISLRTIPSYKNTFKPNSIYEMDLIVSAYSKTDYFIKYDTIINNQKINADTLKYDNGIYRFNTELSKDKNYISIEVKVGNEYGKSKKGTVRDLIKVKK